MCDVLYMQLENERDTRDRLLALGVDNAMKRLLLERIDREIKLLEDKINGQRSEENIKRRDTSGFMADVFQALYRFAGIKKRGDSALFPVPQGAKQQMPEVAQ